MTTVFHAIYHKPKLPYNIFFCLLLLNFLWIFVWTSQTSCDLLKGLDYIKCACDALHQQDQFASSGDYCFLVFLSAPFTMDFSMWLSHRHHKLDGYHCLPSSRPATSPVFYILVNAFPISSGPSPKPPFSSSCPVPVGHLSNSVANAWVQGLMITCLDCCDCS